MHRAPGNEDGTSAAGAGISAAPTHEATTVITAPSILPLLTAAVSDESAHSSPLRHRLSEAELRDQPALIIISHSESSIVSTLRRQFDRYGFRVETETVLNTIGLIPADFAARSVAKVKTLAAATGLPETQIKVIQYELNCGKTGQTPIIRDMIREFTKTFPEVYIITFSGVAEHLDLVETSKMKLLASGTSASQLKYFRFHPKDSLMTGLAEIARTVMEKAQAARTGVAAPDPGSTVIAASMIGPMPPVPPPRSESLASGVASSTAAPS